MLFTITLHGAWKLKDPPYLLSAFILIICVYKRAYTCMCKFDKRLTTGLLVTSMAYLYPLSLTLYDTNNELI